MCVCVCVYIMVPMIHNLEVDKLIYAVNSQEKLLSKVNLISGKRRL